MKTLKTIVFVNSKFESLEVYIDKEEKIILFDEDDIRNRLKIYDEDVVFSSSSYIGMIQVCDLFEYIKFSELDDSERWDYEEWFTEIIKDCVKLI